MIVKNSKQILLNIKAFMTENEIRKKDLAQKMNLSQSSLGARLNSNNITIDSLVELCDALELEINIEFNNKSVT